MYDIYALTVAAFLLMALFGGHGVADYGLQSAYVSEFKVRPTVRSARRRGADGEWIEPVAVPDNADWFLPLAAHCLIHGFLVLVSVGACSFILGLLSGSPTLIALRDAVVLATWLGWAETVIHFAIDDAKGQKRFSYRTDQILHYGCKTLWTLIILFTIA